MNLLARMKTISSAVEDYIKSKPFLVSALTQGIINLTSLARIMNKDIKSVMNKDVRNGAIVMALKRLSSDFEFRSSLKIVRTLRNIGDITVRSSRDERTVISPILRKVRTILREERNSKSEESLLSAITIAPFRTSLFITLLISLFIMRAKEVKLMIPCVRALTKKGLLLI